MPSPRPQLAGPLGDLDVRLRALAARQGGVVTAGQVRAHGGSQTQVRSLLRSGAWCRVRRGVYADARAVPTATAVAAAIRAAAAVAALDGEVVVSHRTAAALLGLPLPPTSLAPSHAAPVVVTREPGRAGNDVAGVRVRVGRIAEDHVVDIGGVPVLAGASVVLDCAATMPGPDALAIADAALRRGITDVDALAEGLARRRGSRGRRAAVRVVERVDARAESWLESVSRWWILDAGLPRPELQVELVGPGGRARLDFLLADSVAGEADGRAKYAGADGVDVLVAEKRREEWIRDTHGITVVRWMTEDVVRPARRRLWLDRLSRRIALG